MRNFGLQTRISEGRKRLRRKLREQITSLFKKGLSEKGTYASTFEKSTVPIAQIRIESEPIIARSK
jgi:hypothetical protein